MRIVVGCDHAGFGLKPHLIAALHEWGHEVRDVGTHTAEPVDFPDIAQAVAAAVLRAEVDRGLLVCGTGVGACIAANKSPGIRAALCHDTYSAHQAVEHDDVNVLCLGAQIVGPWLARDLLRSFVEARYLDREPFRTRLAKLSQLEQATIDRHSTDRAGNLPEPR